MSERSERANHSALSVLTALPPRYGSGSLTDVLPSVLAALGVPGTPDPLGLATGSLSGIRRVAVLLVDGLGHELLPLAAPVAPVIADAVGGRLGRLTALTAAFPSTTPTSLVSVGTGAPPGAHGILGFTVNVPGTDRVLNHVRWDSDPDPALWQPRETQFDRAAAAGVAVTAVSQPEFAGTGLTVSAYRGARYVGASGVDELAEAMLAALGNGDRALVYGYHPDVDRWGHVLGVDSPAWRGAVASVDRLLGRLVERLPADAALVMIADHGMLDVPADGRVDADTVPELRAGIRLIAGEPRVRYLHTMPGARDDVLATWRAFLGAGAQVITREEAVATGWFGPVLEAHLARIGDVVVVCQGRTAVLATTTEPPLASRLVAYHGSITELEMSVPLLVVRGDSVGPPG